MPGIETKAPREPMLDEMHQLCKRAESLLMGSKALTAKLLGPKPLEEARSLNPEVSVSGMLEFLSGIVTDLDNELERQHRVLGDLNTATPQRAIAR